MSSSVGATSESTTSGVSTWAEAVEQPVLDLAHRRRRRSPSRGSPASPSSPISSGGTDRICQNAASADSPRMRSCQALASVWPSTCSGHARRPPASRSSRPGAAAVAGGRASRLVARPGRSRGAVAAVPGTRRGAAGQDGAHPLSVHGRDAAGPGGGDPRAARRRRSSGSGPRPGDRSAARRGRPAPVPASAGGTQLMIGLGGVAGVEVLAPDLRARGQVAEDPGHGDVEARDRRPARCSCRRRPSPGPRAAGSCVRAPLIDSIS